MYLGVAAIYNIQLRRINMPAIVAINGQY